MNCNQIFVFLTLLIANEAINPLLVVSFDGLRADKFNEFVTNNPNSAFAQFYKNGVRAEYMQPSFPSATFPNHITLVTGI
jgi:predicted AlkP superfamily pyrophosphatase or phosphodiesterase